jgi:hypothetical protein
MTSLSKGVPFQMTPPPVCGHPNKDTKKKDLTLDSGYAEYGIAWRRSAEDRKNRKGTFRGYASEDD